ESTEFEQEVAETRPFFEVHIDKFKSHGLRASAADKGLRFDGAHTVRKLESEQRAGRKMTFPGADTAGEIQLRNIEFEIFAQVCGGADDVAGKLEARIASLADDGGVGLRIGGFEGQVLAIDADGGDFLDSDAGVDAQQSLGSGNT